MKTRILSGLLCAALMLTLAPAALAASGTSTPVSEAAQVINALDIMVGDGSGDLQLGRLVNRAEFITMAVKASPVADQVGQASTAPFPDVPYTHWAAGYVQVGVSQGYIAGYLDGTLKPGDPLPSMRLLAKELRISVITTKRAYEELERDGFITTVVGKGSFVREADQEFVREERLKAVEGHLQAAVDAARQCGMEEQEVLEILRLLFEEM